MRTAVILIVLLPLALLLIPTVVAEQPGPPEWFLEEIGTLTKGSGRWISDNASYKSENEPFDAYGTEWKLGIGGKSLTGRLFGLRDGKEVATFWEFRSLWHPGENKCYAYQYGGDGTLGVGAMEHMGGTRTRIDQTFYRADGSSYRVGHEAWFDKDGAQHTQSSDIQADGTWKKRRLYVWKLEP